MSWELSINGNMWILNLGGLDFGKVKERNIVSREERILEGFVRSEVTINMLFL